MKRRTFLQSVAAAVGVASTPKTVLAADSELDCGVWYDAEITDTIDGDTFDVHVYDNSTEYNVRTLGHDTPEKSGNTRYEKTEEWEFIEDETHLEDWGNKATTFAEDELPVGTQCQIKLDCESEEIDQYDRLLAKIRYDRDGDGVYDTVYNKLTLEEGYARVYAGSMSNTDEYVAAQETARANNRGLWGAADGHAPEWRNTDVAASFHPHTSSIRTTNGKIARSRVPVWAEAEAAQENTTSSTISYDSGNIPMVGVDEANNIAYFGGCSINEAWEEESSTLDHFVFITNLIDYLHDSTSPSGPVLVDGGHHTFNQDNAVSAEDTAFYQRFLEGVDLELHSINTYGNGTGYSLSEARALIASCSPESWTSNEVTEVQNFIDNGGVVLLMGSGSETAEERANLDAVAADLGTDLRLNEDDVRDDTNNVGDSRKLLKTANRNTADFDLWSAYDGEPSARTDVLTADPNTAGSSSYHTWTLSDPSSEFSGEVDTITVDYPSGTSLDGLTNDNVTVYMDRDGDGTVDEIQVNADQYSGSTDTFDLDGRYNTSVEGEVRVEIDGVTNPDAGDYVATETLDGDDTYSVDAEFVVE
ncbi:thermonuclease family protein [Halomicrococcus sp. SG-WS-1]|uniref:thermonuclease family protein n=1 Tax=Halomicrococcus sp. SG-WS-1 TaxID=3439057 RepID=UPI003F7ADAA3